VETIPVPEIEYQEAAADHDGPRRQKCAQPCNARVRRGFLDLVKKSRDSGNEEQSGRQAAKKEVIHNQKAPLNRFHRRLASYQVINLWTGTGLRLFQAILSTRNQFRQPAFRIIQVPEDTHLARACLNACRQLATLQTLDAKIALLHDSLVFPKETRVVRA